MEKNTMNPARNEEIAQPYDLEKSLKHWLRKLQEDYNHIDNNVKLISTHQAVPTSLVEYIFIFSRKFGLSFEVKYLAVDLFDRFIRNQFRDVYDEIFKGSRRHAKEKWDKVETRICNQLELRILSCLQIASKFVSENLIHSRIITAKDIHEFLDDEVSFSMHEIKTSEFRVFKTLKFRINLQTIITFLDATLTIVHRKLFEASDLEILREKCYKVCEVLYLNHQEIFHLFHRKLTGLWERSYKDRLRFCTVESNGLLKSAAVILTAAQLFQIPDGKKKVLMTELSKMTNSNSNCIECLSKIILEVIFE